MIIVFQKLFILLSNILVGFNNIHILSYEIKNIFIVFQKLFILLSNILVGFNNILVGFDEIKIENYIYL
jgi:hypothetical protein